ncbi:acyl-CoA thioesterase [Persephonella sp.]
MTFIYKRKVNFYETDAQGIVHHSNYPKYFEEARGFFLEKIGYPYYLVRKELNIDIVLLNININFKKPLEYGDTFEIVTTFEKENRFFFNFKYEIVKENTKVSDGKTRHCCINIKDKKITHIPDDILNKI